MGAGLWRFRFAFGIPVSTDEATASRNRIMRHVPGISVYPLVSVDARVKFIFFTFIAWGARPRHVFIRPNAPPPLALKAAAWAGREGYSMWALRFQLTRCRLGGAKSPRTFAEVADRHNPMQGAARNQSIICGPPAETWAAYFFLRLGDGSNGQEKKLPIRGTSTSD